MKYRLRFYPYSGSYYDCMESEDKEECRSNAAKRIKYHLNKMKYPVLILERGIKWELETGDDAFMIGDGEGILCIEDIPEAEDESDWEEDDSEICSECKECGEEFAISELDTDSLCSDCSESNDQEDEDEDHGDDRDQKGRERLTEYYRHLSQEDDKEPDKYDVD
jgi:hypothetical protein